MQRVTCFLCFPPLRLFDAVGVWEILSRQTIVVPYNLRPTVSSRVVAVEFSTSSTLEAFSIVYSVRGSYPNDYSNPGSSNAYGRIGLVIRNPGSIVFKSTSEHHRRHAPLVTHKIFHFFYSLG